MSKSTVFLFLLAILLLGGFFRFYQITEIPPGLYPDEAMNGNNALEAIATGKFSWFYQENNGREGLFINLQALSLKLFGNEPWALRAVSAVIGTLTILGVYLLARELFNRISNDQAPTPNQAQNPNDRKFRLRFRASRGQIIGLLSAFFLATSFWHINFSRIGFRAIMVPFLAVFGTYLLLKGLRKGTHWEMVGAGIFIGLGFHTYIAFRFMPLVLAGPIIWYLWKRRKQAEPKSCVLCLVTLFLFITFITALPIGYYFLQNPGDFFGRTGQVSVMTAENPLLEFARSNLATAGMFFWQGDCNWRHNFACKPELNPLVAVFFVFGLLVAVRNLFNFQFSIINYQLSSDDSISKTKKSWFENWSLKIENLTLLSWLFFLSLPATLTREGLPHALRAIGMIPPVMIISGLGAWTILNFVLNWLEKQKISWPQYVNQLIRIKKEVTLLFILILLLVPVFTYRQYFIYWANRPETYFAFSTDLWHLGQFLNNLPEETKKFVIVNMPGVEVRGLSMPAQTVMFATDTFREEERQKKNITYLLPEDVKHSVSNINEGDGKKIIAPLKGDDSDLLRALRERFPGARIKAPSDFVILEL